MAITKLGNDFLAEALPAAVENLDPSLLVGGSAGIPDEVVMVPGTRPDSQLLYDYNAFKAKKALWPGLLAGTAAGIGLPFAFKRGLGPNWDPRDPVNMAMTGAIGAGVGTLPNYLWNRRIDAARREPAAITVDLEA